MRPEPSRWVDAQVRLLSDPALRARYRLDPRGVGRELGIGAIDIDSVEAQAEVLVRKRLGEVRKRLPVTFARLGSAGPTYFERHAGEYWPEGHLRHALDAERFCLLLHGERRPELWREEWARVRLALGMSRVVACTAIARGRAGVSVCFLRKGRVEVLRIWIVWPRLLKSPAVV